MLTEFGVISEETAPNSLDAMSRKNLASRMHKLKGVAGTIEATAVFKQSGKLEDLLRGEGSESDIRLAWQLLGEGLTELTGATKTLLKAEHGEGESEVDIAPATDDQVRMFRDMLLGQDLDALTFFKEYKVGLRQRLGVDAVRQIEALLDVLGFEEAAALIPEVSNT